MDNPWATDAWDETSSNNHSTPILTKPIFSAPAENETDIATPSWSSGPAVTWNEPSDDTPPLWGTESTLESNFSPKSSTGWSSTYDNMSVHFGGSNAGEDTETEDIEEAEEVEEEAEEPLEQVDQSESLRVEEPSTEISDPWTPSQSTFPASKSLDSVLAAKSTSIPGSPDAFEFGTFESGVDSPAAVASSGKDDWTSPSLGGLPAADSDWGSAWAGDADSHEEGEQEEEVLDEWERARREKEKLDRVVPPEFLASILHTFEEISNDLVPQSKAKADKIHLNVAELLQEHPDASDQDTSVVEAEQRNSAVEGRDTDVLPSVEGANICAVAEDSGGGGAHIAAVNKAESSETELEEFESGATSEVLNHWKGGIDAVEGLLVLCETITPPLPPLSSLPSISFQSNIQVQSSAVSKRSLEAIRLTRSTLLSSSGPLGMYHKTKGSIEWEVAVKARPEKTTEEEREESVPLGWRIVPKEDEMSAKVEAPEMKRKGSSILSSFFARRAATPPVEAKDTKEASPKRSFTSPRVSVDTVVVKPDLSKVEIPPTSATPNLVSAPTLSTSPLTSPSSSYANGGSADLFQDDTPAAAPSAVSRFLNRFSRARPNHSRKNSNSSLALSTDDLEFLEDIVPSAIDSPDPVPGDLAGLQTMLDSAPLPAPLLPPPRAPAQPSRSSIDGNNPPNKDLTSFLTRSSQILTPSPAPLPRIETTNSSTLNSRAPTPLSFASPISRSSSPGLDMLAVAAGSLKTSIQSTVSGMSRPSSSLSNSKPSTSTMKRPIPVAIMSSSASSSNSSPDPFSFLPPPPSIHQSKALPPSLLIDDAPTVYAPQAASPSLFDDFEDEFSDFHSGTPDPSQPPASTSHLFSLSSAQPLFSAGTAFSGPNSDGVFDSPSLPSADYRVGTRNNITDKLNTSTSSARSVNSANTMLLPASDELDLFQDFDSFESPVPRPTLRTPSPPALPAKSPGKVPPLKQFTAGVGSSGTSSRKGAEVGSKTTGGFGVGGRVAPGRLNLPPPVSTSAYSRNWEFGDQGPSLTKNPAQIALSLSESMLASPSSTSSPSQQAPQRKVSQEAHQRTRSLVEEGIAKSGMWPSPAPSPASTAAGGYRSGLKSGYGAYGYGTAPPLSPLPPILSPPPDGPSGKIQKGDLLGDDDDDEDDDDIPLASLAAGPVFGSTPPRVNSTFAQQPANTRTGVPLSFSSNVMAPANGATNNFTLPPIPLPAPAKPSQQGSSLLMEFDAFGSGSNFDVSSKPAKAMTSNAGKPATSLLSTKTTGALSAQDLSFFEGL